MERQLENITVHYEIYGEGRPFISLHGFSPDHRLMTGCLEPIFKHRSGWRRIYPDLPGMGKTPGEKWITNTDQMLDIVLEFIDQVVPGQSFVLAGESYGGYLARGIIYRRPALVDGLLLICPMIIADHARRSVPPHVVLVKDPKLLSSLEPGEREEFASFAVIQSQRTWERTRDEVIAGISIADEDFLTGLQTHGYPLSFDVDAAPPFEKPTLILVGRQDAMVGYCDAWGILENYTRGTFAVLDRAGHNLQIEQETLFNALVNEWLDRVEDRGKSNSYGQQVCRVISAYQSPYSEPLVISAGEELTIGEKESEWSGWVWCTNQDGKSRWVPEKYVERKSDAGTALYDYEATELSVSAGEELTMGQEESGWVWCTNQKGQSGWVPTDNVEKIQ